jgi:MFS family permease
LVAAAYGTFGISAFISPLIFGALADQRFSPVTILRFLTIITAAAVCLVATAIAHHWAWVSVLILMQVLALFYTPTFGISTAIILGRLSDAKREFGPIRAVATLGWMAGCWLVSGLGLDGSASTGYGSAIVWVGVAAFTLTLPPMAPPAATGTLRWYQRLGLDALSLLKNKDTRTVFLGAAIYNIPLCAFYPYSQHHMDDLGMTAKTAWMTLGQTTEIITMLSLAALLTHWRLKRIFLTGMAFGVLRFVFCAIGGKFWLLAGITLHGFAYALYFITAQIYLEQRIPAAWRARAQSLLILMITGIGSTIGYYACGGWHAVSRTHAQANWPLFWSGLSGSIAMIWLWFAWSYRGRPGVEPGEFIPPTLPPGTPPEPERAAG